MSDRVDRIVFAHDRSLDFVAVASSLPVAEREKWDDILRGHVLVSHQRRPATSMWYWNDGQEAAVLWRMTASGDGRADRCHALVGPVASLDTATALALHGWAGWTGEDWTPPDDSPLEPVTGLRELLGDRAPERSVERDLLPVVRTLLMNPDQPVSIVTDAVDATARARLLWDLVHVAGTIVGRADRWTFSTFETRHDESVHRLPRIIFLPTDHEESRSHPVERVIIGLPPARLLANDHYQRLAEMLVDRYRLGGSEQLTAWLAELGVLLADQPRERLDRLREALGMNGTAPARRPQPASATTDVELLAELGVPRASLADVLAEIGRRHVASPPERPAALRLLLANPPWLDRVHATGGPPAVDSLLDFVIDPADWHDPRTLNEINQALANPATGSCLEEALIRNALTHHDWTPLTPGLAVRHLRHLGFDPPYPAAPTPRRPILSTKDSLFHRIIRAARRPSPLAQILIVAALFGVLLYAVS